MTKCKIFIAGERCPGLMEPDTHINDLEQVVNDWLEKNPDINIVNVTQAPLYISDESGGWSYDTMLSIFYKI